MREIYAMLVPHLWIRWSNILAKPRLYLRTISATHHETGSVPEQHLKIAVRLPFQKRD